ncbi:hypothetical protein GDO86_015380 [Hymenochirus boettgeri]|uniref:NF-kappa-B-repressing factor n=1 Tax=Hymenochirus boettgeri TaxID=247094 RepID=A0A8T2JX66_9PIPI|nr:hypothetical protein GDO86_015380 [Hymenochirus boettgeri]KAG8448264.1 hypothetical protein GDO86_015380 [Hymenochirus boettgeri]
MDDMMSEVSLDQFRQYPEIDKHWEARRQFLAKHLHLFPGHKLNQLISLSVVWSNIVFVGNRYGEQLMEKVHKMAEGIDIGEKPSFDLVPGAKATKRPGSGDNGDQPQKKFAPRFGPRPRFEPVHFVVSSMPEDHFEQKIKEQNQPENSLDQSVFVTTSDTSDHENYSEDTMDDDRRQNCGNFISKIEQNYSAKFESHCSTLSKEFRHYVLDTWKGVNKQGRKGIGFVKPTKKTDKFWKESSTGFSGRTSHSLDKTKFIKLLSEAVIHNMSDLISAERINYTSVLTRSIQACRTNPEYIYVPLKEISPLDLPKKRKLPGNGYACEVRCQDVYLATGYSGSKNGARDQAAEQAVLLLQKPVEVQTIKRKYGRAFREDMIALPVDTTLKQVPPALKQEEICEALPSGQQSFDTTNGNVSNKSWSDFILTENACDAIGILNNSATFNKMTVEYKYTSLYNTTWKCSVFVQGHCVAEGFGNKKNSKHAAAIQAVQVIKNLQPNLQNKNCVKEFGNGPIKQLKNIVVYENSAYPICTLNDTAQFNNVTVEYVFESLTDGNWKCKAFMEGQLLAEAIGVKKTVKGDAAKAAVEALKQTQPVVVNNPKKEYGEDAISRNKIRGWSRDEAFKQQIKEDNIGNQLLRKMGWTGGGLGKVGGGISEPIAVKEQFSREGLGHVSDCKITKRDIEHIIKNYASSNSKNDLIFSKELTNDERKFIHQIAQRYKLKSKSYGPGTERFLVVCRKINKQDLIHQLRQGEQVGSYALKMPQQN